MNAISITPRERTSAQQGFTPLPRRALDHLLCLNLSKRELLILLLVARLTYGCRGRSWIRLRQADLQVVGIGANHARDCLESLLRQGQLVQNGIEPEYRLGELAGEENTTRRLQRLEMLVSSQLAQSSQKGKPSYPKSGTQTFHKEELTLSQKWKKASVSNWRFDRSRSQFVQMVEGSDRHIKDI